MSLSKRLKQGVFGLALLVTLVSGCSFQNQNSRGSFFTVPFLPYTWETVETLDKEGKVVERQKILIFQGFVNSSMTLERQGPDGTYLGRAVIRKKESRSVNTGGEIWRETVVNYGRATRARMMGGGYYYSGSTQTDLYNEKGEFVETKNGTPPYAPKDIPFEPH